nr:hypothetical protein [Tanacetum cinerariifolium]
MQAAATTSENARKRVDGQAKLEANRKNELGWEVPRQTLLEKNEENTSHFHVALSWITQSIRVYIICRPYDEIATCFFNIAYHTNCYCLGSLISSAVEFSWWIPATDQALCHFGSAMKRDKGSKFTFELSYDTAKRKITDSITRVLSFNSCGLAFIAEGYKFRLMWDCFHCFKNEEWQPEWQL